MTSAHYRAFAHWALCLRLLRLHDWLVRRAVDAARVETLVEEMRRCDREIVVELRDLHGPMTWMPNPQNEENRWN